MRFFYLSVLLFASAFFGSQLSAQCPITVDAGPDIYLCAPPTPTQLDGSIDGSFLNFFWTPTTGMTGGNTLSPTVNVTTTTSYVLTGRAADLNNNLITNGDFEGGNFGFSSDYLYSPGDLWPEGVFDVIDNPQSDHPNFSPCNDHTSGSGNMMAINGSGTPNLDVWCQTVPVTPNTQYVFSAWVTTLVVSSPAILQFSINGGVIGPIFNAPSSTCNWLNFYTTWNSGGNSSATICIVNQNTIQSGNDFALDDIVFSPICEVKDTVKVNVVNITAVAAPPIKIIPCDGSSTTLSGVGSSTGPNITYNWDTPNGNIVSGQNTLTPVVNAAGTYTLTVTYDNGFVECTKTATVNVIENPNPLVSWIDQPPPLGCGSATALLIGHSTQAGQSSYQWTAGPGGNFTSGTSSQNATVNQPGEYTLLVTNTVTGCTAEATITVTAATNPPTAVATVPGPITCLQPQIILSGAGSSTGPNISYNWVALVGGNIVTGQNTPNAVVNGPGTYVLSVTNNSNGCTAVDTAIVSSTSNPPLIAIAPAGVFTCAIDTLNLAATLNPAAANPAWTASGGGIVLAGATTLTPQISGPGTYTLLATDPATGCTATSTIQVLADTNPPLAAAAPPDTITCQQPSINLSGAGSSTGSSFAYAWSGASGGNIVSGAATLSPLVNAAGVYTLVVTNTGNQCTATTSVTVTADANAIAAVANAPDTLSCANTTVLLNTLGSSNVPGLTYAWTTTNGQILNGGDTPTPAIGAPGTYQLLLTNPANGCTASDLAEVVQDIADPSLGIAPPDTLTCAQPQQTLLGQNLSLPGSFLYTWTTANGGNILSGDSTLSPLINSAGTYTLTALNLSNGCAAQVSIDVAIETGTPVAILAPANPITCASPTQTLNSTGSSQGGNFIYAWVASAGGHIAAGDNGPAPVVDAPGSYVLTITNTANGCTATASLNVTQDTAAPPATAGPDALLTCANPLFSLSAGTPVAGLQYSWQTNDGHFTGNPNSPAVDCDQAGSYLLTVLNPQNGCTATDVAVVQANQIAPAIGIVPPVVLTCQQTTSVLATTGVNLNIVYQWQTTDGNLVSGASGPAPVADAPGLYSLLVTDSLNGCTSTASVTVQQDIAIPQASIAPAPTLTCVLLQTTLQGTIQAGPSIEVLWTTSNGNLVSGANSASPTVDQPGDYLMTVTNTGNGCVNTASLSVLQNIVLPTANAGPDATLSCMVSNLTLQGTATINGAPQFLWTPSAGGNIASGGNTLSPLIDAPGTYTLLVTDQDNGCTATDLVTILNDASAPNAAVATPGTLTCTVIQLNLQGFGSLGGNFTHQWAASAGGNITGGANTLTPAVDEPGVYTLTVTNETNGCTATAQATVNQNITPPVVSIAAPATLSCAVGTVSLSASPSSGGFAYFWDTTNGQLVSGGATPAPVISKPGTYHLTVTSLNNGCTATANVQVAIDTLHPSIAAAPPAVLNCLVKQIQLTGSVSQPGSNFTAAWTSTNGHFVSGQNSLSPTVDAPGTYVLTVKNSLNGCTSTTTALATQNITPPQASAAAPPVLSCAQPQQSLDASGSTGIGTLSFAWSGGQILSGATSPNPVVNTAASYSLTVTDAANGCTAAVSVLVTENKTPPVVTILPPGILTCAVTTLPIDAGKSSTGPNFTIQWSTSNGHFSNGQNTLLPTVDAPGTYVLTLVDQTNGCSQSATVAVAQDLAPPAADAGPADELHCLHPQTSLQGSSSTTGTLLFTWSTSNGNIVSGANQASPTVDAPGQYLLVVTSAANGCSASDLVTITEVPPPAFSATADQPDCLQPRGAFAFGAVSGGTAPYSYSINNGQSFQASANFSNLAPGDYVLVVRDANGCTDTEQQSLFAPAYPTVELPDWHLIAQGDSVQLQPVTTPPALLIADWQWSPAEGLSCADCPDPWAKPLLPVVYSLTITDQNGCTARSDVQLRVDRRRQLYIPNIFSPNGDGENDIFLVFGRGVVEVRNLRVFDRWGNQLFENEHLPVNDPAEGWDGNFRGQTMQPGVYIWQAVVEFIDGQVEVYAGDVTILR